MITRDRYGRVNRTIRDISRMRVWEHVVYVQMRYFKSDAIEVVGGFLSVILRLVSFLLALILTPVVRPIIAYRQIKYAKEHPEGWSKYG